MVKTPLLVLLVAVACQAKIPNYGASSTQINLQGFRNEIDLGNFTDDFGSLWMVDEDGHCGAGRWYVNLLENRCYTFVGQPANFSSAAQMCDGSFPGSRLAMIPHNSNASEFLNEMTGVEDVDLTNLTMWTDVTSMYTEGEWVRYFNMEPSTAPSTVAQGDRCSVLKNTGDAVVFQTEDCLEENMFMCSKKFCPKSMSRNQVMLNAFRSFWDNFPTIKFIGFVPERVCVRELLGVCVDYKNQLTIMLTVNDQEFNIVLKI